jgi:hypothetical protein
MAQRMEQEERSERHLYDVCSVADGNTGLATNGVAVDVNNVGVMIDPKT